MIYGVQISEQPSGKWHITCRDLPELDIEEDTREAAEAYASEALPGAMVLFYRQKRKAIPLPTKPQKGETLGYVPVKIQTKILFWNFMIENKLRIADVARKLEISHSEAARFVDLTRDSASVDAVEAAAERLGAHFSLTLSAS